MAHTAPSGSPIIIVGSGLAGLVTALALAPQPVLVITTGPLSGECASDWAQGGLAAALGPEDSIAAHLSDTLAAGAGLCDATAVERTVGQGAHAVEFLAQHGVRFDLGPRGHYDMALEGAHSHPRVLHFGGDTSGHHIMTALAAAVDATPSITILEDSRVLQLAQRDGRIVGVRADSRAGVRTLAGQAVVLATGGVGSLWQFSTNPMGAIGSGLALGLEHGAVARDLEMVQFHPTALRNTRGPMPLMSEAIRGQGAVLVNERGEEFIDSLAARDVVARAIETQIADGHQVFLDTRGLPRNIAAQFPTMNRACLSAGIDPRIDLIPVHPAAHYHCGGLLVDARGRTTLPGLWAVGEVASSGLHGANRLASNSLLEAVVMGREAAQDVRTLDRQTPEVSLASLEADALAKRHSDAMSALPRIRALMSTSAGIIRAEAGLEMALEEIEDRWSADSPVPLVAASILRSALRRRESRGGHQRSDFPFTSDQPAHTLIEAPVPLARSMS